MPNTNCPDCIDCTDCENCENCRDCVGCEGCTGLTGVVGYVNNQPADEEEDEASEVSEDRVIALVASKTPLPEGCEEVLKQLVEDGFVTETEDPQLTPEGLDYVLDLVNVATADSDN